MGEHEIVYRILGYSPSQLSLTFAACELVKWDIYLDRVPDIARDAACRALQRLFNGTPISVLATVTEVLAMTPPGWVQAIEVNDSRATMPPEFLPHCGVIAIWTRPR